MQSNPDIFLNAVETGYCLREVNIDKITLEEVFYANWDCNNSNIIYVCHINGSLSIIDTTNGNFSKFRVYLKIALNDENSTRNNFSHGYEEIRYHWDKMLSIPGESSALLFLLGVSKSIMYTTIPSGPHSESQILQICEHSDRITALTISSDGSILASGDEKGYIKLSILQRPSHATSDNFPATQYPNLSNNSTNNNNNKEYLSHEGPIYAIQYISLNYNPNNNMKEVIDYWVASGSDDLNVKIWKISYEEELDTPIHLRFQLMLKLPTSSAHVLCLSSIPWYDEHLNYPSGTYCSDFMMICMYVDMCFAVFEILKLYFRKIIISFHDFIHVFSWQRYWRLVQV